MSGKLTPAQLGLRNYQLTHKLTGKTFTVQAKGVANAFARFVAHYFSQSALKPGRSEYTIHKIPGRRPGQ